MAIKYDEKNDIIFLDQEEYDAMVNKYKEHEIRIMKLEKDISRLVELLLSNEKPKPT